ncbi:hypothetical protein D3C80_1578690 [compost metagenome]
MPLFLYQFLHIDAAFVRLRLLLQLSGESGNIFRSYRHLPIPNHKRQGQRNTLLFYNIAVPVFNGGHLNISIEGFYPAVEPLDNRLTQLLRAGLLRNDNKVIPANMSNKALLSPQLADLFTQHISQKTN